MDILKIMVLMLVSLSSCDKSSSSPEDPVLPAIEVSRLTSKDGHAVLEVDGVAFPILGSQIRLDAFINCDKLSVAQLEPYFAKAEELGINCVQLPIWWTKVEPKEDQYDFSFLDAVLAMAVQHHLRVELLWFSTNMIGDSFSYLVPQYVLGKIDKRLARVDDGAFWNYYGYTYNMIFDESWVLEREKKVVTKMFDHIRSWDNDNGQHHPVISAQIHNEPDGFVRWRMDQKQIKYRNGDALSKAQGWAMTLKALDEVGKAVKASSYRVVTRVNLISGNGVQDFPEAAGCSPAQVAALEGIDIVGVDPYKRLVNEIRTEVLAYRSLPGNYPLICENKGVYTNTPSLMLTALALGGGYDIYDLATSPFFIANTTPDYVNEIDHGIYTPDLQDKPHTGPTKQLLKGVRAAAPAVALTPTADFAAFNLEQDDPQQSLSQTIQTTGAKLSFSTAQGAIGFVLDRKDHLLVYVTQPATITIENGTVNGGGTGSYNAAGEYVQESATAPVTGGVLTAAAGVLYKLNFTSAGALSSTTAQHIGH